MGKKILKFCVEVIVLAALYCLVLWLLRFIGKDSKSFDWTYAVQGLIFAIIYVPISNWASNRKKK